MDAAPGARWDGTVADGTTRAEARSERCGDRRGRELHGVIAAEVDADRAVRLVAARSASDEAGVLAVDRRDEDTVVGGTPADGVLEGGGREHGHSVGVKAIAAGRRRIGG